MRGLSYLNRLRSYNYAPRRQIVGRQFQPDFVSGRQASKTQPRFAGHKRQQPMSISQFYPIHLIWQKFNYDTFNLDGTFSGHVKISGSDSVISTVCSK